MNLDLRKYSTFSLGGAALGVQRIQSEADVLKANAYSQKMNKQLIIIGEGSNTIFGHSNGMYIIGVMDVKGIDVISSNDYEVTIRVGAGEVWDEFVQWSVNNQLSGIEALSGIPGTVGAGPIQNVGAYGKEISEVIISARVFNRLTNVFEELSSQACNFKYRDSVFKQNPQKYIITSVTMILSKRSPQVPKHVNLQACFKGKSPTLSEIRTSKLPDHKEFPNCGCFFINPIIPKNILETIKINHADIPCSEISEDSDFLTSAGFSGVFSEMGLALFGRFST